MVQIADKHSHNRQTSPKTNISHGCVHQHRGVCLHYTVFRGDNNLVERASPYQQCGSDEWTSVGVLVAPVAEIGVKFFQKESVSAMRQFRPKTQAHMVEPARNKRIYVCFSLPKISLSFSLSLSLSCTPWMKIHYQFKQIAISILGLLYVCCVCMKWNRLKSIEY